MVKKSKMPECRNVCMGGYVALMSCLTIRNRTKKIIKNAGKSWDGRIILFLSTDQLKHNESTAIC